MKTLFISLILYVSIPAFSQPGPTTVFIPVKGKPARVTDWGSRAIYLISENYFLETKDSIISMLGLEEFNEMKTKCSNSGWPEGLYETHLDDAADKAFDDSLNKLKMYSLGSYTHIFNGNRFDRYVILRVPYSENKDWNPSVKWEGNIYFLLKEQHVELL